MPKHHNLFKRKPDFNRDVIVYKIPCKECDQVYIGQTGQGLTKRIKQHSYCVRNGTTSSAVAEHFASLNHAIDFENTTILSIEGDTLSRIIQESYFIHKEPNLMLNNKSDFILKLNYN